MKLRGSKIAVRVVLATLAIGSVLVALKVAVPRTAHAASSDAAVHHVINGSSYLHTGNPMDTPTFSSPTSDLMQAGTEFDVQCVTTSDAITPEGNLATDGNGDTAWEYGTDAATGNTGFMSDQGLDTHVTQGQEIAQLAAQGVPECSSQNTGNAQPKVTNPEYDRMAAVNWALAHAQDPQTHDEECAYFVSQTLWAGQLPQTDQWKSQGSYVTGNPLHGNLPAKFMGTETANVAPDLIRYLEHNFSTQWIPLGRMSAGNNNVPQAQVGDIIAYSWDGTGNIDHLAFVVGAAADNSEYPLVAEWGQFGWNLPVSYIYNNIANPNSPYVDRGWTWSAMDNTWLQNEPHYQNMTAYLLHFNGGFIIPNY